MENVELLVPDLITHLNINPEDLSNDFLFSVFWVAALLLHDRYLCVPDLLGKGVEKMGYHIC